LKQAGGPGTKKRFERERNSGEIEGTSGISRGARFAGRGGKGGRTRQGGGAGSKSKRLKLWETS